MEKNQYDAFKDIRKELARMMGRKEEEVHTEVEESDIIGQGWLQRQKNDEYGGEGEGEL